MKSFQTSLACAVGVGFLFLFLGGCNIKWEVVQDPYVNYHRIEQRVQIQINQINNYVQNGSLWPPMAQVLSENDDMIRQMAWHDQGGQSVDLTPQQAATLDSLLNDNAMAINDAVARHDQWTQAFQGGWAFSSATYSDRLLTIAYLHYRLDRQQAAIDDALQSGEMTPAQAQDMKTRIQIIRNSETGCYAQNGRLDLTVAQINRLRQMEDDNDRFIRFRSQSQRGRWKGDQYGGWSGQKKQYTDNPWMNGAPPADDPNRGQTSHGRYWDGRPLKPQASAPTSTPVPVVSAPTPWPTHFHAWNPTPTSQPLAAMPTATSVPVVSAPTAVPTPAPTHFHAWNPTPTSQPLAAAPTSTPVPVVSAPTSMPTPASQPAAQAPTSTPVPSQDQSDDSNQPDQSRHGRHGDLSGNNDNGGNAGDSDGSNHHGHSDNQGGNGNSQGNDSGN